MQKCFSIFFFIFILMSSSLRSDAQNTYLDSLKTVLHKKNLSDLKKIDILILLGDNLSNSDFTSAIRYYTEAFQIASSKQNNYHMGRSQAGIGKVFYYKGSYDTAMNYYTLADSLFAKDNSMDSKASGASNKASIGNILVLQSQYEKALNYFLRAIEIIQTTNTDNKWLVLGSYYSDIANVYHELKQNNKALSYDLKALGAFKKQNQVPNYTATQECYVADDYIALNDLINANQHLIQATEILKHIKDNGLSYQLYFEWGSYYRQSKLLDKAIESYKKALELADKLNSQFSKMNALQMIGFTYFDKKDYQNSELFLSSALSLAKKLNNKKIEASVLKKLADVHFFLLDFSKAASLYKRYDLLHDSLNESDVKKRINELETKYQFNKKQDSILVLQKSNQLQTLSLHKKTALTTALIFGCFAILLIAILFYSNLKKKNQLLKQSEALHAQKIIDLEKQQQLLNMQSVLKGQEQERSRLARDLHDGVGGLLSGVKLSLSTMKGNVILSEQTAGSISNVIAQLDQSINELRRVSHNMMPESLIKYGLKEALENYCEHIQISGTIHVRLQTYGLENRLEQNTEIILYRIVQELLNNVLKHSEAKNVLVQIICKNDRFSLTVEDDGKGFDITQLQSRGIGFTNIKARAEYLAGTVDIHSALGEGTSVNVEGSCS